MKTSTVNNALRLVIVLLGAHATSPAESGVTEAISINSTTHNLVSADLNSDGVADRVVTADGRYVAFKSSEISTPTAHVAGLYLRDRQRGTFEKISVPLPGRWANGESDSPSITPDGRYVAFESMASTLVESDTNGRQDVFVRDRLTKVTERVSVNSGGIELDEGSEAPSISADGRYVAFVSHSFNLSPACGNYYVAAVVLRDRLLGRTDLVTCQGMKPSISADGRYIAFGSTASDIVAGDTNDVWDVFVYDRDTRAIERVSVSSSGAQANAWSADASISADGRFVAFDSQATNLVPGYGANGGVYVHDRYTHLTETVTVAYDGSDADVSNGWSHAALSADGRYVAFASDATNLVPGDTNNLLDVFIRDRQLGVTLRTSVSTDGTQADRVSGLNLSISATGRYVAFMSQALNLVPDVREEIGAVYLHDNGGPTDYRLTLVPTALAFGSQAVGTNTALSFWLHNNGATPLPLSRIAVVGLDRAMFSINSQCGVSVSIGASCRIRVTFRPSSAGPKTAQLQLIAGDNDERTKALTGTGAVSAFSVAPTALDFGSAPIGTTTPAKVFAIRNTGSAVLPISSITVGGWNPYQFSQTHNCPANLAVGATCMVNVVFKPTTPIGSKAALLNITPGGGAAIRSVALAGAARR